MVEHPIGSRSLPEIKVLAEAAYEQALEFCTISEAEAISSLEPAKPASTKASTTSLRLSCPAERRVRDSTCPSLCWAREFCRSAASLYHFYGCLVFWGSVALVIHQAQVELPGTCPCFAASVTTDGLSSLARTFTLLIHQAQPILGIGIPSSPQPQIAVVRYRIHYLKRHLSFFKYFHQYFYF